METQIAIVTISFWWNGKRNTSLLGYLFGDSYEEMRELIDRWISMRIAEVKDAFQIRTSTETRIYFKLLSEVNLEKLRAHPDWNIKTYLDAHASVTLPMIVKAEVKFEPFQIDPSHLLHSQN